MITPTQRPHPSHLGVTAMKNRTTCFLVITAAILLCAPIGASAALLAEADFNDLSTGALNGQAGGSGLSVTAWAGSSNPQVVAGDLTYANYFITQSGTAQRVQSWPTSDLARQDHRALASAMSGDIWFSVLVQGTADGHSGLTFNLNGFDPTVGGTTSVLLENDTVNVSLAGSTSAASGTYSVGATHLILGHMVVGVGNDTMEVWVDPDLTAVTGSGDLGAANFSNSSVDFAASIDRIGAAVWTSNFGVGNGNLDAIVISDQATAFYDVTGINAIPTPAALPAGLALMLAVAARRRR